MNSGCAKTRVSVEAVDRSIETLMFLVYDTAKWAGVVRMVVISLFAVLPYNAVVGLLRVSVDSAQHRY